MKLYVGTSGFAYKEWKGPFYPEKLPAKGMLSFYAGKLPTVEINNTFYRMPKKEMLLGWRSEVPEDFTFVLKASQRITHIKRLKEVAEEVAYFFQCAEALSEQLGPSLFQLPPNLKKDLPRLTGFLGLIPKPHRVALEFRHESWFSEDVYQALRDAGAALCIAEADDFACPFVPTAPWGYLRLRKTAYAPGELAAWAKRLQAAPWEEAYVFFKHEDAGDAPRLAAELRALLQGS